MISFCGDPDCEGIGKCGCRDWNIRQKQIGLELKEAYVQFKELKKIINEEQAFNTVIEPVINRHKNVE